MNKNEYSNIAKKVLTSVNEKDQRRLEQVGEDFLKALREELANWKGQEKEWQFVEKTQFKLNGRFAPEDISKVCAKLGFTFWERGKYSIVLSVPKKIKGSKETEAQRICREYNVDLKKARKIAEESAKNACEEAFTKLNNGEYETKYIEEERVYQIELSVSIEPTNDIFIKKTKQTMESYGFSKFSIGNTKETNRLWTFQVDLG